MCLIGVVTKVKAGTITKIVGRDKLFPIVEFSDNEASILTNFDDKPFQYGFYPESEN